MLSNIDNKDLNENIYSKPQISFKLDTFDGPMDLLLELVKEKKTDILTLDIVELSIQYLEFVNTSLNSLPIDDISEYLVIAAYLTELKSKMIISLLNDQEIDIETELEIDLLRRQLFLYKQYKDVVNDFRTCQHIRTQFIAKPCDALDEYMPDEMPYAELPNKIDLDRLVRAWRKVLLESQSSEEEKVFTISVSNIDVDDIEKKLVNFITNNQIEKMNFHQFIKKFDPKIDNVEYICAIFFALLSLSKNGIIKLHQNKNDNLIYISKNLDNKVEFENADIDLAVAQQKEISQIFQDELTKNKILSREEIKSNRKNNDKIQNNKADDSSFVEDDINIDDELNK